MAAEEVSLSDFAIELPPPIEKFLSDLESDRKKLMKDQAYGRGEQLQLFIGTFLYPRLIEALRVLSTATFDVYGVSVTNSNNLHALRAYVRDRFRSLGIEEGAPREALDEFQHAFYALGSVLGKKLPNDKEAQAAYNKCAQILAAMVAEMTGGDDDYDDDDEGDDGSDDPVEGEGDDDGAEADDAAADPHAAPSAKASGEASGAASEGDEPMPTEE